MRAKYATVDAAESAYGLTVEEYSEGTSTSSAPLRLAPSFIYSKVSVLTASQRTELFHNLVSTLPASVLSEELAAAPHHFNFEAFVSFISGLFSFLVTSSDANSLLPLLDSMMCEFLKKKQLAFETPITTISGSMDKLLREGKNPYIPLKFASSITSERMPLDRMPFGLIEHQINFFDAQHINQVSIATVSF